MILFSKRRPKIWILIVNLKNSFYLVQNTTQKMTIKDKSQTCTPVYGQLKGQYFKLLKTLKVLIFVFLLAMLLITESLLLSLSLKYCKTYSQ